MSKEEFNVSGHIIVVSKSCITAEKRAALSHVPTGQKSRTFDSFCFKQHWLWEHLTQEPIIELGIVCAELQKGQQQFYMNWGKVRAEIEMKGHRPSNISIKGCEHSL